MSTHVPTLLFEGYLGNKLVERKSKKYVKQTYVIGEESNNFGEVFVGNLKKTIIVDHCPLFLLEEDC